MSVPKMQTSGSKKRKRHDTGDTLAPSSLSSTSLGPVVAEDKSVSLPSIEPELYTPFSLYTLPTKAKKSTNDPPFPEKQALVVAETKSVEFETTYQPVASTSCRYMVGVRDKRTNVLTIREAPLHLLSRQVKALKSLKPLAEPSAAEYALRRAQLGEAFGTKKAITRIRAAERNKVDISAMEGVMTAMQDTIGDRTENLPTVEEAKSTADSNRPIPAYNEAATVPEEVYPLNILISDAELSTLETSYLEDMSSDAERERSLAYSRSAYLNAHLKRLCQSGRSQRNRQHLLYAAALMEFKKLGRKVGDKKAVAERLQSMAPIVIDSLYSRFTETGRGSTKPQMTKEKETLLLTHLFALCLHLDNFATHTRIISDDLSMSIATVNQLFKSLGCKLEVPSTADLQKLNLPPTEKEKRAFLRIPLEFPKLRRKRAKH
ncbi:RNA polymerase I associated factor, A49-like protein [Sistotremastrum suecicum HHB10207 ss-3]|uniref:RNA polymerase I associated factor, A49-like protein n=1 Tax=Sistotremastrum suecicum HHB10207 ss-3 TaxID=1314776 RepID=A0A166BD46_9AGAM|nr:RNA polymerase I associated factor, A49-like protein [Sistotremastrum suecicum HHB10207 ss-3]